MNPSTKADFKNLSLLELQEYCKKIGEPLYRAGQVFSWLYQKNVEDIAAMKNLPSQLRTQLEKDFYLSALVPKEHQRSQDGTQKFLFALKDGNAIETVLIPHEGRNTLCISTQVGCRYGCAFCASGKNGFVRNLSQAEILSQILAAQKTSDQGDIGNLVFMGIGEPLDNYENLLRAIRIIIAADGIGIGQRKITISTSGLIDGIRKFSDEGLQVELSVSLHAATNEKRNQIMPINKLFPLEKLIPALKEFCEKTKRKVTFEYMLLGGFNTSIDDAQQLLKLLRGVHYKINVIPFNPIGDEMFGAPTKLEVLFFKDFLVKHKVDVTIRKPRGQDIDAACGQLRLRSLKREKA